ncbi:MAG: alpha/beta hydrolase [Pseudodonghicola sp.]|tara:strand:+ start:285 stop:1190 length:906 start_codon:yes stop_codon:yes gene_type:complete
MTMASNESDYLRALYQDWSDRMTANPEMTVPDLRALFDEWEKPTMEPEGVTYKSDTLGGVDGVWAYPAGCDQSKVMAYTHGGGFAVGSSSSHRKMAGHLAKALGVSAFILDYRRAPEHPYPAQIEDAVSVYQALVDNGIKPGNILTAGDSAGGNLAVATVLKLRDLGLTLPGAVIAFSPWLDMELSGGTLSSNEATDALVSRPVLEGMRGMFLGEGGDPADPLANPLKNDFAGYPPLYINAGEVETLRDDATRLADKTKAAGVNTTLSVVDGMQHVFPFLAGRAPEADAEIARIGAWYKAL